METKKVILVVVIIGVVAAGLWFLLGSQFGVGTFLTKKQPTQSEIRPYLVDSNTVVVPPEIADRVFVITERGKESFNNFVVREGNSNSPDHGLATYQEVTGVCRMTYSTASGNLVCTPQMECSACYTSLRFEEGEFVAECICSES